LRYRAFHLGGDRVQGVHDFVELFSRQAWPRTECRDATSFGRGGIAVEVSATRPARQWTPHDRSDFLIERERHQLPLIVARYERVVRLMRNVPRPTVPIGERERFHQMPT